MPPEHDIEPLRVVLMNHEGRIAKIESTLDNERARHASAPAWIFGVTAALVGLGSLLLNLLVQFGGRP